MITLMSFVYNENDFLVPPKAKIVPNQYIICGEAITDNYFWLRNREDPDVIKYINEENHYTDSMMRSTKELQDRLFSEILSRTNEKDITVPEKIGNYFYYYKTEPGKQYPVYCRKKDLLSDAEEVIVDQNELEKEYNFLHLEKLKVSPDHNFVAFSMDTTGSEEYTIIVKDLRFNVITDTILLTSGNFEWSNDSRSIFYTVMDDTQRPFRLYFHQVGITREGDRLIYEEKEKPYYLDIEKTKDKEYLLVSLETITSTEVFFISMDDPDFVLNCMIPRKENVVYSAEHSGSHFYIYTNDEAENFRVLQIPENDFSRAVWKEAVPHNPYVSLEEFDIFRNYLVVYQRENGLQQIRVVDLNNNRSEIIRFEEPVYSVVFQKNPVFDTDIFRYEYSSFAVPNTTIDYNMNNHRKEIRKVLAVKDFDHKEYISERIFAVSNDGTRVPVSLFYKKGLIKNGNNPFYLIGYGAYGINSEVQFQPKILSLVDRGFIYAIAHIRGGSELGRKWYDEGKLLKKENTFNDFIASINHVIKEGYTSSDKMIISGGSAGGLLIGAVLNRVPGLVKAAVASVPFVDVINTMRDTSLPLTVHEFDEWGNPYDENFFKIIRGYSPYDNVQEICYPHLLITASMFDSRVPYWEPVKWTAKLRAMKRGENTILLKVNMDAGHSGSTGRYDYIKETAFQYAFILDKINITK